MFTGTASLPNLPMPRGPVDKDTSSHVNAVRACRTLISQSISKTEIRILNLWFLGETCVVAHLRYVLTEWGAAYQLLEAQGMTQSVY